MSMTRQEREEFENDTYKLEPTDFVNVPREITSIKPSRYETKPKQYQIGIDTFDRLKANATREEAIGFCKYNIDKYTHRNKGCDKEDIGKIKDYCDLWQWVLENKC